MRDVSILTDNGVDLNKALELLGDLSFYDETLEASVEVVDSTTEATDVLNVTRIPNLRVTLLPSKKTTEKL